MKNIHIGSVKIPLLDYAVSCTAILGIRDSGKTVTAKGIAEQLLEHGVPIVVFDAVGKWRWMKVPGTGPNAKGYKVVVAGGRAPDLALNPQSVGEIVRSAVKEKIPLIIDLYDPKLSKADWRRIVQQSIRIIHYEANGVAHVFLEEAAEFIPQKVMDGDTYAEVEKLARMGGNASVGITLINQRSQEVNKAVLDLAHNLVLGCQIGNKAIEAVEKWVDRLSPDTAKAVTSSLPKLQSGEAWVWTRSNPDDPKREKLPMCRSLHPDRRTPDVVLKSAQSIDPAEFVQRLNESIPKVIADAKANDPSELKREIARLKKELDAKPKQVASEPLPPEKVSVVNPDDMETVRNAVSRCEAIQRNMVEHTEHVLELTQELAKIRGSLGVLVSNADKSALRATRPALFKEIKRILHEPRPVERNGHTTGLGRCERAILTALAQYPQGRTVAQVAVLTGYSGNSGGFNNSLGKLRSSEYITRGQPIQITDAGLEVLGDWTPLPTGEALMQHWLNNVGKCERAILETLFNIHPQGMTADDLGDYSSNSGGFNNALGRLRTLELITRGQPIKASDHFFQEA